MKRYALKTKNGELVTNSVATDKIEATEFFSNRKMLSIDDLLKIYLVEEVLDKKNEII